MLYINPGLDLPWTAEHLCYIADVPTTGSDRLPPMKSLCHFPRLESPAHASCVPSLKSYKENYFRIEWDGKESLWLHRKDTVVTRRTHPGDTNHELSLHRGLC